MILLDTGYLLALFNPSDALHRRAVAWAEYLGDELLVTEYVLLECVNALSKPTDRRAAHAMVDYACRSGHCRFVEVSAGLLEAGLQFHRSRPDKAWSLTDCVSFHVMQETGIRRALAHDLHFEQAGFEALLRNDPPDAGR